MTITSNNCGLRIADCRSAICNPQSEIRNRGADRLPRWWRATLVAIATLLLCSCQLPPADFVVIHDSLDADVTEAGATPSQFVIDDTLATPLPAERSIGEVRQLADDQLLQARPIELPTGVGRPVPRPPAQQANVCLPADGSTGSACGCSQCGACAVVGPSDEYLCDGGDYGLPVGVRADWTVDGLQQEDTAAHYDTVNGEVYVVPSNRVCFYAPRFAAVRRVEGVIAHERRQLPDVEVIDTPLAATDEAQPVATSTQRHAVVVNRGDQPPNLFRVRQQPGGMENRQASMDSFNAMSPYANLEIIRSGEVVGSEQALLERAVQAAVTWAGDQAVQVVFENKQAVAAVGLRQPGIVYMTTEPNSPKLRLLKLASTNHALPGEVVEFTLRFDSVGDQVIGNVTIVDNLATRLEYVADSAKSSVPANFSSVPNGAGSSVLRWEITDPLEPGDGGILTFTARVR